MKKIWVFILIFITIVSVMTLFFVLKDRKYTKGQITSIYQKLGKENQALKEEYGIFKSYIQHEDYLHCFDEVDLTTPDWFIREVSRYNAGDINQCAGDPCESANGEDICLALEKGYKRCACNFVPFGTVLEIEGYGECLVVDRLAEKYKHRVDIAMKKDEKAQAIALGVQRVRIRIISIGDGRRVK